MGKKNKNKKTGFDKNKTKKSIIIKIRQNMERIFISLLKIAPTSFQFQVFNCTIAQYN